MLFNEGAFIKVDQTKCLNYQHNGVGCIHCTSLCPGGALTVVEDKIFLEHDRCLGCGVCFSNCPTEVFTAGQWDETAIISEVKSQAATVTQFFCEYHDTPFLSKDEKEKGAIQITACLSSISKGAWYEIGLLTDVELRLEKCAHCPMKDCTERLKHSLDTAAEWLEASGHSSTFSYIFEVENIQKKKKLKAVSAGMRVTSRRDLFLSLFNQGKEVINKIRETDQALHGRGKGTGERLLPKWQQRMQESYTANYQEGGNPAYWPSIIKKSSCVNCGLCIGNCPAKALGSKKGEEKIYHTFKSGQCLDCRICELFCPTNSIERGREPNSQPFETQTIHEMDVIPCEQCGKQTADNDQHLCFWCQNEAREEDMISDVRNRLLQML